MKAVLSIDHTGKPRRPRDLGAIAGGLSELDYTSLYAFRALIYAHTKDRDLSVMVMSSGEYSDRWAKADEWGASVYISCHANAGGGNRGEVFYDHRTTPSNGLELSRFVAKRLEKRVDWPVNHLAAEPDSRALACIRGVKAVALVYEPVFIDGPLGPETVNYCEDYARALVDGISDWRARPLRSLGRPYNTRAGD